MAKRKRSYGSVTPTHRSLAATALKRLRKGEKSFNSMLKLGPRYCHGALSSLLHAEGALSAYNAHRTAVDYKLRKGMLSAGKRLTRLQARFEAACMR